MSGTGSGGGDSRSLLSGEEIEVEDYSIGIDEPESFECPSYTCNVTYMGCRDHGLKLELLFHLGEGE